MGGKNKSYQIPERFLRQLWKNRQFVTHNLRTIDNQPLEIITPGKVNQDGGPDFIDAVLRISGTIFRGEVEIHQYNDEWFQHKHHEDAKYNSVILHVVLYKETSAPLPTTLSNRTIPVLTLDKYLTSEYRSTWERMILDERAERLNAIKCYSHNDNVESSDIQKWLEKLAVERIELKVRRFEERLKELINKQKLQIKEPPPRYGDIPFGINPEDLPPSVQKYSQADFRKIDLWEQLLYEGIMEALGYSKNQEPFLKLARNVPLTFIRETLDNLSSKENDSEQVEAILFGIAGFLIAPHKEMDNESKKHLNSLRCKWKDYRRLYKNEFMKESEWQFFRLRPDNFPTVRLAGAVQLVQKFLKKNVFRSIVQIIKRERKTKTKFLELEQMFIVPANGFWSTHFRFGETSKSIIKTLIGKSRVDEIILNVIITICLLYARIFKDKDVRGNTLKIFGNFPPLSENTITKIISSQLIKSRFKLNSAMLQQGVLQCYKFYCIEEKCGECIIGKLTINAE